MLPHIGGPDPGYAQTPAWGTKTHDNSICNPALPYSAVTLLHSARVIILSHDSATMVLLLSKTLSWFSTILCHSSATLCMVLLHVPMFCYALPLFKSTLSWFYHCTMTPVTMALSNFLVSAQFTLCKPCFVQISQFHETEAHSKSYRTWILESTLVLGGLGIRPEWGSGSKTRPKATADTWTTLVSMGWGTGNETMYMVHFTWTVGICPESLLVKRKCSLIVLLVERNTSLAWEKWHIYSQKIWQEIWYLRHIQTRRWHSHKSFTTQVRIKGLVALNKRDHSPRRAGIFSADWREKITSL